MSFLIHNMQQIFKYLFCWNILLRAKIFLMKRIYYYGAGVWRPSQSNSSFHPQKKAHCTLWRSKIQNKYQFYVPDLFEHPNESKENISNIDKQKIITKIINCNYFPFQSTLHSLNEWSIQPDAFERAKIGTCNIIMNQNLYVPQI